MDAAHTNAHLHRPNSNCPFLSVVETAGLCHVNERGGWMWNGNNWPSFFQRQICFGVWRRVYGCCSGSPKTSGRKWTLKCKMERRGQNLYIKKKRINGCDDDYLIQEFKWTLRKPCSLMCEGREAGWKGTGEQNTDRSLFVFFLTPNLISLLFYFQLDSNWVVGGRGLSGSAVIWESVFSGHSGNETSPATVTHFLRHPSSLHFLLLLSSIRQRDGGISVGGLCRKDQWDFEHFACPLP